MDWISGIQRAIDYIEEHICEEIDYSDKTDDENYCCEIWIAVNEK